MGHLVRTKLRKEWNFFFDTIGKCFSNKYSNFEALTQTSQHIGYSLISNDNYDFAPKLLEYIGIRIKDNINVVYTTRFVHLIFQYLCPNIVFEEDTRLPVFSNTLRSFRDLLGIEKENNFVGPVNYPIQARHILHQRLPTVYGSIDEAVI